MNYKILSCTKELRPLKGSQDQETLYTGLKIAPDRWVSIRGDFRSSYGKTLDLEFSPNNPSLARLAQTDQQQPVLPPTGQSTKPTYNEVRQIYLDVARDLSEWGTASPRGFEAMASIACTLIIARTQGNIEPIPLEADPVPDEVKGAYEQTKEWTEV